jgi:hypothetical protein
MTTRAELRSRLRRFLDDPDPSPRSGPTRRSTTGWRRPREYGARFPREATATIAPLAGQTDYPLPDDARRVVRVESPPGQAIARRPPDVAHEAGAAQSYAAFGGALHFGLPPTAPLLVAYRGPYPWPEAADAPLPLPGDGLDLVLLGAAILALGQRQIAAAKRRGGSPPDGLALETARGCTRRRCGGRGESWVVGRGSRDGRLGRSRLHQRHRRRQHRPHDPRPTTHDSPLGPRPRPRRRPRARTGARARAGTGVRTRAGARAGPAAGPLGSPRPPQRDRGRGGRAGRRGPDAARSPRRGRRPRSRGDPDLRMAHGTGRPRLPDLRAARWHPLGGRGRPAPPAHLGCRCARVLVAVETRTIARRAPLGGTGARRRW